MKLSFTSLLLIIFLQNTSAQKEANMWYFGDHAALDFNSGSPVALTNSAMYNFEGCASIADANGALLFYTEGSNIWNKNHAIMANGTGLMGNSSSTQSAVIIPLPGSTTIYFVFTVDEEAGPDGLRYSVVDMSLQGGLGQVTLKNVPILSPTTEKVNATEKSPGVIWVMTHQWNSNNFYCYTLDAGGFNATPVISSVGSIMNGPNTNTIGYMKFSPNGKRIALAVDWGLKIVELYDFDKSTGVVSNPLTLTNTWPGAGPYGIEFSPNSNVLYAANESAGATSHLYQWNLEAGSSALIIASLQQFGNLTNAGALQLGPDLKIYLSQTSTAFLAAVNDPNVVGSGCNFVTNQVSLANKTTYFGLPDFISSYFLQTAFEFEGICFGDTTFFTITTDTSEIDSLMWYFNDPASGMMDSSKSFSPYHIFTDTGTFNVVLKAYGYNSFSTDTVQVIIYPLPDASIGNDTTICKGDILQLNAASPNCTYQWHDGSTNSWFVASASGSYMVTVTSDKGCISHDTLQLSLYPLPVVNLGPDTTICSDQSLLLDGTNSGIIYLWNDGTIDPTLTVNSTGLYWVKVTDINTCSKADSINVTVVQIPPLNLGNDTLICLYDTLTLSATWPGVTYLWSNGSANATYNVYSSGTYWCMVTDANGCINRDTIVLGVLPPPPVNLGSDVHFCLGTSATLNGTTNGAVSYYWYDGTTNATHVVNTPGVYWIEVANAIGCKGFDTIAVYEQPYPFINLGPDTLLCNNATLLLDATSDTLFKQWQNGSNQNTYLVTGEGMYYVKVVDKYGCASSDSIHVEYQATPVIDLGSDSLYCFGDSILLNAFYPDATYIWNNGSTNATQKVYMTPGSFHVDVSNECGYYSDEIKIEFHNCISCVNMPNVFTPNNDGLNDIYKPLYDCPVGEYTLRIFNRWGQLIFISSNVDEGWDGRYNGRMADLGTYAWYLTYQNMDKAGVEYFMEGNVILLR